MDLEECHKSGQSAEGPLLGRQDERVEGFQPGEEQLWGDLIVASQYLKRGPRSTRGELLTRVCNDRKKGNGFELEKGRCKLGIRKKFFPMWVAEYWRKLHSEVVEVASPEMLKVRLDGALKNLV